MNEFNVDGFDTHSLKRNLGDSVLVRITTELKSTARTEVLIIPIRKALLEIELTVSNKLEFEPHTAQHQFTLAATDYNY